MRHLAVTVNILAALVLFGEALLLPLTALERAAAIIVGLVNAVSFVRGMAILEGHNP